MFKVCFAELKIRCAGIFVAKCESVNSLGKSLGFSDLDIAVTMPRLSIVALQEKFIKPLSPSSAHAPSIHRSWPCGVAKRVYVLAGGSSLAMSTLFST